MQKKINKFSQFFVCLLFTRRGRNRKFKLKKSIFLFCLLFEKFRICRVHKVGVGVCVCVGVQHGKLHGKNFSERGRDIGNRSRRESSKGTKGEVAWKSRKIQQVRMRVRMLLIFFRNFFLSSWLCEAEGRENYGQIHERVSMNANATLAPYLYIFHFFAVFGRQMRKE